MQILTASGSRATASQVPLQPMWRLQGLTGTPDPAGSAKPSVSAPALPAPSASCGTCTRAAGRASTDTRGAGLGGASKCHMPGAAPCSMQLPLTPPLSLPASGASERATPPATAATGLRRRFCFQ
eukprot:86396-Chlamydomonas_euryale.AAC.16